MNLLMKEYIYNNKKFYLLNKKHFSLIIYPEKNLSIKMNVYDQEVLHKLINGVRKKSIKGVTNQRQRR